MRLPTLFGFSKFFSSKIFYEIKVFGIKCVTDLYFRFVLFHFASTYPAVLIYK